jgi:hypothetical protein
MEHRIIDCHFHPAVDEETDTGWFYPSGSIQHQIDALKRAGISQACGFPVRAYIPDSFGALFESSSEEEHDAIFSGNFLQLIQ